MNKKRVVRCFRCNQSLVADLPVISRVDNRHVQLPAVVCCLLALLEPQNVPQKYPRPLQTHTLHHSETSPLYPAHGIFYQTNPERPAHFDQKETNNTPLGSLARRISFPLRMFSWSWGRGGAGLLQRGATTIDLLCRLTQ